MIHKSLVPYLILMLLKFSVLAQEAEKLIINKDYYAMTLRSVLIDLSKSYNLQVDYNQEDVKGYAVSSGHFEMPLGRFMETILTNTDLKFKIVEDQIQIRNNSGELSLNDKVYVPQADFTLTGLVRDQETGEILPFAQIIVVGTTNGTTSNVDGYFTLFHVPSDTSQLLVGYVGYEKKTLSLTPRLVNNKLVIDLVKGSLQLADVNIVGERKDLMKVSEKISETALTPREIAVLPSLGEKDIFRTFQLLPGISGSNEGSAGLYVRGGTPDQNLILYDGFTVYHVDHLFGMFSTFNSNAVIDVKLFKGGFESRYGGRLSSVMDIVGKDGNENNFNLGADLSFLSFNAFTEFPVGKNITVLFAFRRSFQSALYNKFFENYNSETTTTQFGGNNGNRPFGRRMETAEPVSYFYDINSKISYNPSKKDIISWSIFNGKDVLDNSRENNRSFGGMAMNNSINDLTDWGNLGSSLKWSRKWNQKFYTNTLISYSNYFSIRDRTSENTRINEDDEYETMKQGTYENNDLQDFAFKTDNQWEINLTHRVEFGLQANYFNIKYNYQRDDTITIQNRDDQASLFAFYLQDNWTPVTRLCIIPGVRVSYYTGTQKPYFEPRLSASYALTERWKLKAAWGEYDQFAQRVIREDIQSGSKDFWMLANDEDVSVSSAEHYIVGFSYETSSYLFDVEAYYKQLNGLTEYTLRYIPQFGSVDYNEFYYTGDGYAQGIEFLVQKKFGNLSGWMGYTLGEVIYNFPVYGDNSFAASHDVTHEFKMVGIYKLKKWTFSMTWIFATGKPYTKPLGGYQIELPDETVQEYIMVGQKNGSRYPNYHRLDMAVSRNMKFGDMATGAISFSLFNVYNRKNVWYKEFEMVEGQLIETDVNLLGITPNITLSFSLK